jgi:hypothetical protein
VLDFLQLREQCLHAYAIDRLWYAIIRTSLLLSSKHTDGATDGAIESAHDRRTLLLSSKHTDGATDGAIKPSLDSAIDRTWIALDRTEA